MESEITQYITYRTFAGVAILVGVIISALGAYYYRTYNTLVGKLQHDIVVKNQDSINNNINTSTTSILRKTEDSAQEIISRANDNKTEILKNQQDGFEDIKSELRKDKNEAPKISGILKKGVRKGGKLLSFKSRGVPDRSVEREGSWLEFKSKNNLEHHILPLRISNYSENPIYEINFKVYYNKPVIAIGEGLNNVPIPEVRNFPGIYDLDKLKEVDFSYKPFEWITNLLAFENFYISELGPKETLEFEINRITDRFFLQNPKIEIRFTGFDGQKWLKKENKYMKI